MTAHILLALAIALLIVLALFAAASALARYRASTEPDPMWDDLHRDLDAADTRLRQQKAEARAYGEGN